MGIKRDSLRRIFLGSRRLPLDLTDDREDLLKSQH